MQSELQKAADRVRDIQEAIDEFEPIAKQLEQDVKDKLAEIKRANVELREINRNLEDTRGLLHAQYQKRSREVQEMTTLCNQVCGWGSVNECASINKY